MKYMIINDKYISLFHPRMLFPARANIFFDADSLKKAELIYCYAALFLSFAMYGFWL